MIVDEQPYFRTGVRQTLTGYGVYAISEAAPDAHLLDIIEEQNPDVVLLGADLAEHKSLDLAVNITRNYPVIRVVILSLNQSEEQLFNVIRSTAVACLPRNSRPDELVSVIERASKGEYPINDALLQHPVLAQQVLRQFQDMSHVGGNFMAALTRRECQVLENVANGKSNKQIAGILGINEQTIKNHVSAILRKLNANDRAHAVVLAIKRGIIQIGD
jgi:DNA-binding NarL/FixJ family response regulator